MEGEELNYSFVDGRLCITVSATIDKETLSQFLLEGRARDYEDVLNYLTYLQPMSDVFGCTMTTSALTICAVVSEPIDDRTVARYRCIYAATHDDGTLEEWLTDLGGEYNADEELASITKPYWKDFSDLHFSQVLFCESIYFPFDGKGFPWDFDVDLISPCVKSVDKFHTDVDAWARRRGLDVSLMREVSTAAIALDAERIRSLLRTSVERMNESYG